MTSTRLSSGRSFLVENSLVSSLGRAAASGIRDCTGGFFLFPSGRWVGARAIGESPFGQGPCVHRNLKQWLAARKWALARFLSRWNAATGGELHQPAGDAREQRGEAPDRSRILQMQRGIQRE